MPGASRSAAGLWLGRLSLLVLSPILLFAVAELTCWAIGVAPLSENKAYQQQEFMRDCRAAADLVNTRCAPEVIPVAGRRNVFVFGGSSVQGYPVGETTPFSEYMQAMLERRHPGQYRVHNQGVACRDSIFMRKCASSLGGRASDIFVIYAGHNDMMNFMVESPRLRIFFEEYPQVFALESALAKTRLFSFVYRAVRGKPKPKVASFTRLQDPQYERSKAIALDTFESNVRRVIEQAAERSIDVVLVTVVSNVAEYPARRDEWQQLLNRERPFPAWMQPWREHFGRGVALFEEGRFDAALVEFKAARDQGMAGRAPSALNQRLRDLADESPHVHLVDFERRLDRVGVSEGLGCSFFGTESWCDQFHPNPRTQRMIAKDVVAALSTLPKDDAAIRGTASDEPKTR
jgi:lysophospholipase L1-like esterase